MFEEILRQTIMDIIIGKVNSLEVFSPRPKETRGKSNSKRAQVLYL
jgi:hypothetical protein